MTEQKISHTPGPWFAGTGWVGAGEIKEGRVVCRVDNFPYAASEANLQLIAAAPELLAALETCLQALIVHDQYAEYDWHNKQIGQATAAIRKAKGE